MTGRRGQGGYWYAHAVWESDLAPSARLVALVLAGRADNATGRVVLSLTSLARMTGLGRSTVARHLNLLEAEGWVLRARPRVWEALKENRPTELTTLIPSGFPSGPLVPGRDGGSPGNDKPQSRSGTGVVPETRKPSPATGHRTISSIGGDATALRASVDSATSETLPHELPANYGSRCTCPPPTKHVDGECIRCGGVIAA